MRLEAMDKSSLFFLKPDALIKSRDSLRTASRIHLGKAKKPSHFHGATGKRGLNVTFAAVIVPSIWGGLPFDVHLTRHRDSESGRRQFRCEINLFFEEEVPSVVIQRQCNLSIRTRFKRNHGES